MLAAYDTYVKYVKKKDDKELPKIMYHRAKLMMIHNNFDDARCRCSKEMITKFDDVKEAQLYAAWCSEMLGRLVDHQVGRQEPDTPKEAIKSSEDLLELWRPRSSRPSRSGTHPESRRGPQRGPDPARRHWLEKGNGLPRRWRGLRPRSASLVVTREGFKKCATAVHRRVYNDHEDHDQSADTSACGTRLTASDAGLSWSDRPSRSATSDPRGASRRVSTPPDTLYFVAASLSGCRLTTSKLGRALRAVC